MPKVFLPAAEWTPDLAPINSIGTESVVNVYPQGNCYRPWKQFSAVTDALDARCQGAIGAKDNSGQAANFAGDATKLYKLSSTLLWEDVTRTSGGAYATSADEFWEFTQFGLNIIAVNGTDDPQVYTLGSSSNFAALGGSPPSARHIAVVRDFVVLGNLSTGEQKIQWSGFNNSAAWTVGANQSDEQDFPDGGWVQRIVGGEVGYVIQERAIRRMTYVGGDVIFQIDKVENLRGTRAPQSVVQLGPTFFYLGQDGFYWFTGESSKAIGSQKVNGYFLDDVNESFIYRVAAAIDPQKRVVLWAYPSNNSTVGATDKIIGYKWDEDKWFNLEIELDYMYQSASLGVTLDGLDSIYPNLDTMPISLDSAAFVGGALTLAAFNTSFEQGEFTGTPLEATVATEEFQPNTGGRVFVNNTLPVISSSSARIRIGSRERRADTVAYTGYSTMLDSGHCPIRASGRSVFAEMNVPAGTTWDEFQGMEVEYQQDGVR